MTVLLDANVLIASLVRDHVHHDAAETYLAGGTFSFATCPSTEGSLVRLLLRHGAAAASAASVLRDLGQHPRHEFWPDEISYRSVDLRGVVGHRQVTDAYLAMLARDRGGRLATFDRGLVALHHDVADLVSA
ncbi:type II toxin-antitoxin system ribonuclease VapC29 [soil metagenome]